MRRTSALVLALGALFLLGGLVTKAFRPTLSNYGDASMIVGAVLLVAFLVVERAAVKDLAGGRRVKYGANALLYTVVVVAIVGALNWVGNRHVKRFDLTEEKLYTLSEQSTKVLSELDREVVVTALFTEAHPQYAKVKDLLVLYQRVTPKLKSTFVDPTKDPALVERLDVRADGTTVFESGKQKTTLTGTSEELFTNAIIKVSRDVQPKVYLAEGAGEMAATGAASAERGFAQAKEQLLRKGFEVASVNLSTTAEIPRDAAVLVLADPLRPLPERSVAMVKQYLAEGGRAIFLLDSRHDSGLAPVLQEYGITVGDDIVIDPTLRMLGGPAEAIMVVGSMFRFHPITDRFPFSVYLSLARSVTPRKDPPAGITVTSLFECSRSGWAETDAQASVVRYDEGVDKPGPVSLAVAATWKPQVPAGEDAKASPATPDATKTPEGATPGASPEAPAATPGTPEPPPTPAAPTAEPIALGETGAAPAPVARRKRFDEGRLVVVGDADWASDVLLPDPSVGNAPLFVNMAGWLGETEEIIAVPPKKPGSYQVKLGREQGIALLVLTIVVVPFGIIGFGLSNWWRRRRL